MTETPMILASIADDLSALATRLDNLWPDLSEEEVRRLVAIEELIGIHVETAEKLRDVADAIQEEADQTEMDMAEADESELLFDHASPDGVIAAERSSV